MLPWIPTGTQPAYGTTGCLPYISTCLMGGRRRHPKLLRSCMLMPPSRTRKRCLRSNIAPLLAGENVQHINMLCMSHSVCYMLLTAYHILWLGCLKVASRAQFSYPGFGPRYPPTTTQYLGQLIGFSAGVSLRYPSRSLERCITLPIALF